MTTWAAHNRVGGGLLGAGGSSATGPYQETVPLSDSASPGAGCRDDKGGWGGSESIRIVKTVLCGAEMTFSCSRKGPGERICHTRDKIIRAKKRATDCAGNTWQLFNESCLSI